MRRYFCIVAMVLGLCTAVEAVNWAQPIPLAMQLRKVELDNGVVLLTEVGRDLDTGNSLRVIWRHLMGAHTVFALDGPADNWEDMALFLEECRNKQGLPSVLEADHMIGKSFFRMFSPPVESLGSIAEVVVIAVGEFPRQPVYELVNRYLGSLPLSLPVEQDGSSQKGIFSGQTAFSIDFQVPVVPVVTYEDLRAKWSWFFLQELFQQRMERCTRYLRESWIHPQMHFLYPTTGEVLTPNERWSKVFRYLAWEIQQIKDHGFCKEEFFNIKNIIKDKCEFLLASSASCSSAALAFYYADQFLHGLPFFEYSPLMRVYAELIGEAEFADVQALADSFFQWDNKQILVFFSPQEGASAPDREEIEEMFFEAVQLSLEEALEFVEEEGTSDVLVSWQGFSFLPQIQTCSMGNAFLSLPLTEEDKKEIYCIISTVAEYNIFQLLPKKKDLKRRGAKIDHVHPLCFIGYIVTNPYLRKCLREIRTSSFKWNSFMDGFSKHMKQEYARGGLEPYIAGFSEEVKEDPNRVREFIHLKNWEGLVNMLLRSHH